MTSQSETDYFRFSIHDVLVRMDAETYTRFLSGDTIGICLKDNKVVCESTSPEVPSGTPESVVVAHDYTDESDSSDEIVGGSIPINFRACYGPVRESKSFAFYESKFNEFRNVRVGNMDNLRNTRGLNKRDYDLLRYPDIFDARVLKIVRDRGSEDRIRSQIDANQYGLPMIKKKSFDRWWSELTAPKRLTYLRMGLPSKSDDLNQNDTRMIEALARVGNLPFL
jgi:hypothetical protein